MIFAAPHHDLCRRTKRSQKIGENEVSKERHRNLFDQDVAGMPPVLPEALLPNMKLSLQVF